MVYSGNSIDLMDWNGPGSGIGSAMIAPGATGTPTPTATPTAATPVTPTPAATPATSPTPGTATPASSPIDIAARIAQLTGKDSATMRAARTEGMKQANRRGLMNSSIGIGAAQSEAIKVAAPIASQESQQQSQRDLSDAQIKAQRELTTAQLASQERGNIADNFSTQMANYQQALANTLANDKIPASSRAAVQASLRDQLNYGLSWMQKLYGVTVPG